MKRIFEKLKFFHIAFFLCFTLIIITFSFQIKLFNDLNQLSTGIIKENSSLKAEISICTATKESLSSEMEISEKLTTKPLEPDGIESLISKPIETIQSLKNETMIKQTTSKITTIKATEHILELDSQFIVNVNSKKIHSSTCASGLKIKDENKIVIKKSELQSYLDNGYEMCSVCKGYKK
ncbi:MAG: hypothetical protein RR239_04730 [Oscillospiraceae bacterium]